MSTTYRVPFESDEVEAFRRVPRSRGARRVAVALTISSVLAAIALAFVPWQQTGYGEGTVVAYSPTERPQSVQAPVGGRIGEWFVQEGARVREGDPIVRIVDVDPDILTRLRAELRAARARVRAAETAVSTARRNVARQNELIEQGLAAPLDREEAQLRVADALQKLASAQAELAQVETRVARQDVQLVTAPRDGVIVRVVQGEGGMFVDAGEELATLVPAGAEPAVELWLDGNELPLVRVGAEVRVQFEGWPALQLSGWPGVAVGTFGGRVGVIDAAATERPGYVRVLVRPGPEDDWPSQLRLRQGAQAHGWVLAGVVPLGYELWRRFNDFPPQLPPPVDESERDAAPLEVLQTK